MTTPRRFLVVDLEATCWERAAPAPNEIIEIGSVCYDVGLGPVDEFQTFVRPILMPALSPFCKELTQVRQSDVDAAPLFPEALRAWCEWAADHSPWVLASWGLYDRKQLAHDCGLHGVDYPFAGHVNIKAAFAKARGTRPCGMAQALHQVGLPLVGTHHRGIDDARNIARLLDWLVRHAGAAQVIRLGATEAVG